MNRSNFAIPDNEGKAVCWKLLCYEIMYLWNLLGGCSSNTLEKIIEDCQTVDEASESILGLKQFLMGATYTIFEDFDKAIKSYNDCIQICNNNPSALHLFYIPAYSCYELAVILMKNDDEDSKREAQKLLRNAQIYKNFDFEHRLKLKLVNFKTS